MPGFLAFLGLLVLGSLALSGARALHRRLDQSGLRRDPDPKPTPSWTGGQWALLVGCLCLPPALHVCLGITWAILFSALAGKGQGVSNAASAVGMILYLLTFLPGAFWVWWLAARRWSRGLGLFAYLGLFPVALAGLYFWMIVSSLGSLLGPAPAPPR